MQVIFRKTVGAIMVAYAAVEDAAWVKILDWIGRVTAARDIVAFVEGWLVIPQTAIGYFINIGLLTAGTCLLIPGHWWSFIYHRVPKLIAITFPMLILAVGFGSWWFWQRPKDIKSNLPDVGLAITPAPIVPASPTPRTAPQYQEPEKPWVTDEEIERERKEGRILIPESPEELVGINMVYGKEKISAYVNKWVKISYKFSGVERINGSDKKYYLRVQLSSTIGIYLALEERKWEAKILTMRVGETINTICQLYMVDGTNLMAINCDAF